MEPNLQSVLSGGPQPQGAPSAANPGGMPSPDQDPAAQGFQICVASLKQLAQQLTMMGDAMNGNQIDAIAVKVNKMYLKRTDELKNAMEQVQQVSSAAYM